MEKMNKNSDFFNIHSRPIYFRMNSHEEMTSVILGATNDKMMLLKRQLLDASWLILRKEPPPRQLLIHPNKDRLILLLS
jgi:hypothetical protein